MQTKNNINSPQAQKEIHFKIREIIKTFYFRDGIRVLDAAAGSGYMSSWLYENGYDVTALDVNIKKWKVSQIPVHFADLNKDLCLENNSFDMVISIETIEHLENPFHFLKELHRVTKPNGLILISTPNIHSIRSRLKYLFCGLPTLFEYIDDDNMGQHITPVSIAQFIYIFRKVNSEIINVYTTGPKQMVITSLLLNLLNRISWLGTKRLMRNRKHYPEHYFNILSEKQIKEINRDVSLIVLAKKN